MTGSATDGYRAEAVIAENVDEIMEAKGTKYIRVPMMSKLEELIAKGKRKLPSLVQLAKFEPQEDYNRFSYMNMQI